MQDVTKYHNIFPALLHSVSTCAISLKKLLQSRRNAHNSLITTFFCTAKPQKPTNNWTFFHHNEYSADITQRIRLL